MQEAYFKARKHNVEDELLGKDDITEVADEKEVDHPTGSPKKVNKSKQTLMKILEEDRGSSTSSKMMPRSKSGFLMPYK
jgi:hypothetical protein